VLGSSQIRIERRGEVWVVSGDYKRQADPTCAPFEPVRCHTFVTESTFGLPVYRWEPPGAVFEKINAWWAANRTAGVTSVIFAYSLGKAQRVLAGVDASIGPIFTHGAVENMTRAYRESGVPLPATTPVGDAFRDRAKPWVGGLVVAPPSADGSPWMRKFQPCETAVASGWMATRGPRRRQSVDRGFVLSDHADWPGLLATVKQTGASRVYATHGFAAAFARHLRELGTDAGVLSTRYGDEDGAGGAES
jgi:putative mRNA 3-end processing factor